MRFHRCHRRHIFELSWHTQTILDEEGTAEVTSHTLKHLRADVHATIGTYIKAAERTLHGVDKRASLQLFEYSHARSCLFRFLHSEARSFKLEEWTNL